jgi:ornithine cyclodeaminase
VADVAPLWIREGEVVELLDLADAIRALERALVLQARGYASNLDKTVLGFGRGDTLHALGAVLASEGLCGTKTWAHTEGGATPLLVLFDAKDGALVAVIEAFALGQLRTAAVSGVATEALAPRDARELALLGCGKQALPQVAAVAAVRELRRVRAWSPSPERRAAFAGRASEELGLEVVAAPSAAAATEGAPIVTTVTRAKEPFLGSAMLAPGAHVNAIGAIALERAELLHDVFPRVRAAVADAPAQVRAFSREFRLWLGEADAAWRRVAPLASVVAGIVAESEQGDLTLFKAMGMGISDVALGTEVLRRARAAGQGRAIERPERVAPRLGAKRERTGGGE